MECDYCTDDAIGYDEDGYPTCGHSGCTPSVRPIGVIETNYDDDAGKED